MWCKFWRKMFLYLWKYSYKAYKWIFNWNSKHTNSFWKEKCKKRKMKESMSQSCHFHDFHSITHSKTYFIIEIKPLLVLIDDWNPREAKITWIDVKLWCLFVAQSWFSTMNRIFILWKNWCFFFSTLNGKMLRNKAFFNGISFWRQALVLSLC